MTRRHQVRMACQRCRGKERRCTNAGLECAFDHSRRESKDELRAEIERLRRIDERNEALLDALSSMEDADTYSTVARRLIDSTVTRDSIYNDLPGRLKAVGQLVPTAAAAIAPSSRRNSPATWDRFDSLLTWDHLPFCLLCKDQFLQDFASGEGRYCSPALVNSLLALSTLILDERQHPHQQQHQKEQQDCLAKSDADGGFPTPVVRTVRLYIQTLGILALYQISCGREAEARELAEAFKAEITKSCRLEPLEADKQDDRYMQVNGQASTGRSSVASSSSLPRYSTSSQGRYGDEESALKLVGHRQEELREKHPDTITSIANLAAVYHAQGRYNEAEFMRVKALDIRRETLGEKHPDTLSSMGDLAATSWNFGGRCLEKTSTYAQDHGGLAATYRAQGRYEEDEEVSFKLLELLREVFGEKHPDTIGCMEDLATMYYEQGCYDKDEEISLKVLELRQEVLGEQHPDTPLPAPPNSTWLDSDPGLPATAELPELLGCDKSAIPGAQCVTERSGHSMDTS
ncbi:hypothetical protein ACCO45_012785 [Purpureocillium lilacinum]|uniref:Uncharacterized protein n=1 Tax=Purpureocillium lilacinum TaxID=33203 RepID=A0ACC4D9L6_PURLI